MTLGFDGPDGESFVIPVTADEVAAFLSRGGEYWHDGSGTAAIRRYERTELGWRLLFPKLSIVVRKPFGVHLVHQGTEREAVNAFDPAQPSELVEHQICGQRVYFPRSCFVPEAVAARVIADFFPVGARSAAVAWRRGGLGTDDVFAFDDV
jgi:Immunity protein Imm1